MSLQNNNAAFASNPDDATASSVKTQSKTLSAPAGAGEVSNAANDYSSAGGGGRSSNNNNDNTNCFTNSSLSSLASSFHGAIAPGAAPGPNNVSQFNFAALPLPVSLSFIQQQSHAQQAEAAYAVAAMAEKHLAAAMSGRGSTTNNNHVQQNNNSKNSNNANNTLLRSSTAFDTPVAGAPYNAPNSNNTAPAGLFPADLNKSNMHSWPAAGGVTNIPSGANTAFGASIVNFMLPGSQSQGMFNTPGTSTLHHSTSLANGYQAPAGVDLASIIGNSNLVSNSNGLNINAMLPPSSFLSTVMPSSSLTTMNKKKKAKNKPKRPLSAYNLFFKQERQKILDDLTDKKTDSNCDNESGKEGSLNENTTHDTSSEDENENVKNLNRQKPAQDVDAKRPQNSLAKKKPHGKIGFENLAKTIGQRWAKLDGETLKKYKELADEDMKRYKREMEIFLTKKQEHDIQERGLQFPPPQADISSTNFNGLGGSMLLNNPQLQIQLLHQQQLQQQAQQEQQKVLYQQQLQRLQMQQHSLLQSLGENLQNSNRAEPKVKKQKVETLGSFPNQLLSYNSHPLGTQLEVGALGPLNSFYGNLPSSLYAGNFDFAAMNANASNSSNLNIKNNDNAFNMQQNHQGQS